jgi:metal-sulfur cluster biosynthetic enzyme
MASAESEADTGTGVDRAQILDALSAVYDPELDEPITTLRFVSRCEVTADGGVKVRLRLPTPQCAPNFAFLMAADARSAIRGVPGVGAVEVELEDHYTGAEINAALRRGEGFAGAFPGETEDDDLEALRELFVRKALIARQSALCEQLLSAGASRGQLVSAPLAELPDGPQKRRCIELRRHLDIAAAPDSAAFVLPDGDPLTEAGLERWLRMGRLVRTGLEANGGICRSLLAARHGIGTVAHG